MTEASTRAARIPATVVTGFLGAGKTTLIRNLLAQARGRRIAVIVNEFGEMGFDGALIADCEDEACRPVGLVELTNGCICCTVADDFLPAMEALIALDPPPDHIVVETSGLALPQPLLRAFAWPAVRHRVTVDGVVTVVDASALADGRLAPDDGALAASRAGDAAIGHDDPVEELFSDQLRCADLVVLSKSDLLGEADRVRVARGIADEARAATRAVESTGAGLPLEVLLGLASAAEDDVASRPSRHEAEEGEHHDHDDFDSFVTPAPTASSLDGLKARISAVMALPGVLRIKGSVAISGKAVPAIVQAVGPRVETYFSPAAGKPGLVVIGLRGLDRARIEAALAAG